MQLDFPYNPHSFELNFNFKNIYIKQQEGFVDVFNMAVFYPYNSSERLTHFYDLKSCSLQISQTKYSTAQQ